MDNLAKAIRNRRKSLKITQADLADLTKISVNTLYKIETGEGNPTLSILEKIAEVLGMQLQFVIKQSGQ